MFGSNIFRKVLPLVLVNVLPLEDFPSVDLSRPNLSSMTVKTYFGKVSIKMITNPIATFQNISNLITIDKKTEFTNHITVRECVFNHIHPY